tara:strand:+ start:1012 stop:1983 length:972 start_codon:yes stop_codon:yes gene_type:complete
MSLKKLVSAVGLTLLMAGVAHAEYPKKDIINIIPWSAGGGTDAAVRGFMHHVEKQIGAKIVNQNITGAQSGIGIAKLMRSRPDGYTIGSMTWDSVITVPYNKLVPGYDLAKLHFLGTITMHPTALVVAADAPWKTLEEFAAAAKAAPNTISVSNVGSGGVWHLPALDMADKMGIELRHIPYPKGSGPQREALLSGETDAASISISGALPALKAGKARVLGVMGEKRDALAPDAPTFKEAGFDVLWGSMRVVALPKDAPDEAKTALEEAFAKTMQNEEFLKWANETGMGPYWMGAEDTAAYIKDIQAKAFRLTDDLIAKGILKK